ncbi:hypothetical protein THOM_3043 [Trachipleistophora hominis]|uniref:Uncharacterized protein n=1 Tax=Trachipleistophora hominis TaxID=72359 RepID=L7JSL4_TRAHO|nr:hypothetical protein THOM_3043 [Trachipleistophora hominis]
MRITKQLVNKVNKINEHEDEIGTTLKQSSLVENNNMKTKDANAGNTELIEQTTNSPSLNQPLNTTPNASHDFPSAASSINDLRKTNLVATNTSDPNLVADRIPDASNSLPKNSSIATEKSLLNRGVRLAVNSTGSTNKQTTLNKSNLLDVNSTGNLQSIPVNLKQNNLNEMVTPSLESSAMINVGPPVENTKVIVQEEVPRDNNPTLIQLPAKPFVASDDSRQKILVVDPPVTPPIPNDINRTNNDLLAQLVTLIGNIQNPNTVVRPISNAGDGIDTEHRYLTNNIANDNKMNYSDTQCKNDVSCMQIKDLQMGRNNQNGAEERRMRNSDPCLFYKTLVDYTKDINFLSPDMKKELNRIKSKFVDRYRTELKTCLGLADEIAEVRTRYATTTRGFLDGIVDFFKDNGTNGKRTDRPRLLFDEINNINGLGGSGDRDERNRNSNFLENREGSNDDITITRYVTLDNDDKISIFGNKTITKTVTVSKDPKKEAERIKSNNQIDKQISKRDIVQDYSPEKKENKDKDSTLSKNMQDDSAEMKTTNESQSSSKTSTGLETSTAEKTSTVTKTLTKSTTITITQDVSHSYSSVSKTPEKTKSLSSDSPSLSASISSSTDVSNTSVKITSDDGLDVLSFIKKLDSKNYTTTKHANDNKILESIYSIIIEIKNDEGVKKTKKYEKATQYSVKSTEMMVSTLTITQTVDKELIRKTNKSLRDTTGPITETITQSNTPSIDTIAHHENILKEIREDQKILIEKLKNILDEGQLQEFQKIQPSKPKIFESIYSTVDVKNIKPAVENVKKSIDAFKNEFNIAKDINIEIISEAPSIGSSTQTFSIPGEIYSSIMTNDKNERALYGSDTETVSLSQSIEVNKTVGQENSMQYYKTIVLRHKSSENDNEDVKIKIEDQSESNSDVEKVIVSGSDT